jgi:hypothetical protein
MIVTTVELNWKQYAAIHLCVPDSGDEQIDAMIRRAQRERLAGQILSGYFNDVVATTQPEQAKLGLDLADALIAAGGVGK